VPRTALVNLPEPRAESTAVHRRSTCGGTVTVVGVGPGNREQDALERCGIGRTMLRPPSAAGRRFELNRLGRRTLHGGVAAAGRSSLKQHARPAFQGRSLPNLGRR